MWRRAASCTSTRPDIRCDAFTTLIILKLAGRSIGLVVDSVSDGMGLRGLPI